MLQVLLVHQVHFLSYFYFSLFFLQGNNNGECPWQSSGTMQFNQLIADFAIKQQNEKEQDMKRSLDAYHQHGFEKNAIWFTQIIFCALKI